MAYMVVPCDLRLSQFLLCWWCSKRFIFSWSQLKTCWTVIRAKSEQFPLNISQLLIADTFIFLKCFVLSSHVCIRKICWYFFHKFLNLFSIFWAWSSKCHAELGTCLFFFIGELPPPMTFFLTPIGRKNLTNFLVIRRSCMRGKPSWCGCEGGWWVKFSSSTQSKHWTKRKLLGDTETDSLVTRVSPVFFEDEQ